MSLNEILLWLILCHERIIWWDIAKKIVWFCYFVCCPYFIFNEEFVSWNDVKSFNSCYKKNWNFRLTNKNKLFVCLVLFEKTNYNILILACSLLLLITRYHIYSWVNSFTRICLEERNIAKKVPNKTYFSFNFSYFI